MKAPGRRALVWAAVGLACAVAGAAAARAALPSLVGWAVRRGVERSLGMRAAVGEVGLSLWRGEARLADLRVTHPRSGAAVAGWADLRVRVLYAPLLRGVLRIEHLRLDRPFVALAAGPERPEGDAIPLAALTASRSAGGPSVDLDLGRLEIEGGKARLVDVAGSGRSVALEDIAVRVADLATRADAAGRQTQLEVAARWAGGRLEATGWIKPLATPLEGDVALRVADLDLALAGAFALPIVLPAGSAHAPDTALTIQSGQADLTARLVRGGPAGTLLAGRLEVRRAEAALAHGGGRFTVESLVLAVEGFDGESFTLRGGRIAARGLTAQVAAPAAVSARAASLEAAVEGLDFRRGAGGPARLRLEGVALANADDGVGLESAAVRAAVEGVDIPQRSARGVTVGFDGLIVRGVGAPGAVAEARALRAVARGVEAEGRRAEGLTVEFEEAALRGIGGPDVAGRVALVRAGVEAVDATARSARGLRVEARGLDATGLGPRALSAQARGLAAAAREVAPGAWQAQGISFALEGVAVAAPGRPLGSLEALRAGADAVDVARRSATGLRVEVDQAAVAEMGPQGLSGRVQALRAEADAADADARTLEGARLEVDWLAAARAGEAEPFAVLRGARAEGVNLRLAPPAVAVARLELDAPVLRARRDAAGIDLARLPEALPAVAAAGGGGSAPSAAPAIGPQAVAVGLAQIREGALHVVDATVSPEMAVDVRDLTVNLLNLRPGGGAPATLVASATVGDRGTLQAAAQFTPGTFRSASGTVRLENIDVDLARPFLRLPPPLAAITGRLTLEAEARPTQTDAAAPGPGAAARPTPPAGAPPAARPAWKLVARAELRDLAGRAADGHILAGAEVLDLREVEIAVPDLAVVVGEVTGSGITLPVERDAGGTLRVAGMSLDVLTPPPPPTPGPRSPGGALPPVRVRHAQMKATVPLVDRARAYPLETAVTDISLELTDVGTTGDGAMGLRISGRLEEMTFAAAGSTRFGPLRGFAYLDLASLDVVRWADYLPVGVRGRLADLRGAAQLEVTFGPSLADLAVRGRVEAAPLQLAEPDGDGVVAVEKATIAIERLTLQPPALHASAVTLERPRIRLERRPDGGINLMALLGASPGTAREAPPGGGAAGPPLPPLRIDRLTLQNGAADVIDRTLAPPFRERLRRVEASVSNLSTDGTTPATFELTGRLGDEAEVALRGRGVPRPDRPSVEVDARLGAFNLVGLSPYVRQLTSHRIQRGKIEIDAHYRVEHRQLDGRNRIRIDQLGVGEPEEWPDKFTELVGISLPTAVSLLQDDDGVIELDLPVRGDVANPEFDLGDAIQTAIKNAVVATVTAPFRLIGKIFTAAGRIEGIQIDPVVFEPGSAALAEAGKQGVARLVAFLNEAPRVRLQLAGYAEPELDGKALLAAQAARAAGAAGVVRRLALRLGVGSPPPPPDLHGLARRRAVAVQEALRRAGVEAGRVFLAEPAVETAAMAIEREKPAQGRVEFRIVQ